MSWLHKLFGSAQNAKTTKPAAPPTTSGATPLTWQEAFAEVAKAMNEKRYDDCLAAVETCVAADGISASMVENCRLFAVQSLTNARRYEDAVDYLNAHCSKSEPSPALLASRAAAFIGLGWYDEALPLAKAFLDCVEKDEGGTGHAILGACLLGKGNAALALDQLEKALAIDPKAGVPNVVDAYELVLRCVFQLRRFGSLLIHLSTLEPSSAFGMLVRIHHFNLVPWQKQVKSHANWADISKASPQFTELCWCTMGVLMLCGRKGSNYPQDAERYVVICKQLVLSILGLQADHPASDFNATLNDLLTSAGIPDKMFGAIKVVFNSVIKEIQ